MVVAIIAFVVILGVLVFVHELGHFLTARRNGVKADEFGFGFPPRAAGFFQDEETKKYKFIWGNQDIQSSNTIYSINWIPLGGFVKIKGEDGTGVNEADSFAAKKAWPRIKILAAGVIMNFILAWFLLSLSLMLGAPQEIDGTQHGDLSQVKIQINTVSPGSPAESAGIKVGDEILKENAQTNFKDIQEVQSFIKEHRGQEIALNLKRGDEVVAIKVVPRENAPQDEGALGIAMSQTAIVAYPIGQSLWMGVVEVYQITLAIVMALGGIVTSLFVGKGVGADVSGPIGIAILTKQVATLGLTYILRFAALLSINLGIINALPIPALDGGRILFILIEKIKGSPVDQETEQKFHTIGFILLLILMAAVTLHDVIKYIK